MSAPQRPNDISVLQFARIDSTNVHARRLFEQGELSDLPLFLVADEQTGGVGRFGRRWESPRGGLWCTLVWRVPTGTAGERVLDGLGLRIGVAVLRVVRETLSGAASRDRVRLKWPNDILINGRKVSGVLCELLRRGGAQAEQVVLVGVGINANIAAESLAAAVSPDATSLIEHIGRSIDLNALRSKLAAALAEALSVEGVPLPILAEARERLHGVGQTATIMLPDGTTVRGMLRGLDDNGGAVLDTNDGTFHAAAGSMIQGSEAVA